jgi:hypothetical protein
MYCYYITAHNNLPDSSDWEVPTCASQNSPVITITLLNVLLAHNSMIDVIEKLQDMHPRTLLSLQILDIQQTT